ncbi:MAG: response regulator transcription factor [Campylobacteraceae bacterium]
MEIIDFNLKKDGFYFVSLLSTKNVEKFLSVESFNLMIVDRNIKEALGCVFVNSLRNKGINIPVIFVSAKDKDSDVEEGFIRGGDDYVKKPFNMKELILRVKALLSRSKNEVKVLTHRDILLNLESREVFVEDKKIELTKLEFDLLNAFLSNKNSVLNREYLLEHVWKDEEFFQDKTVNVAISRLIKKIDKDKTKKYIKPVWGVGYTLC